MACTAIRVFMASSSIHFNTFNTRRNLPSQTGRKRGEELFVSSFERVYMRENHGVGGKQFALPGFGVADFVWAQLDKQTDKGFCLSAFEMKLSDWGRALNQAYRYSYFAHLSYVVLPTDYIANALGKLPMFEKLGIGLMEFNAASENIVRHCPPSRTTPRNETAHSRALGIWQKKLKFRELLKDIDAFE